MATSKNMEQAATEEERILFVGSKVVIYHILSKMMIYHILPTVVIYVCCYAEIQSLGIGMVSYCCMY